MFNCNLWFSIDMKMVANCNAKAYILVISKHRVFFDPCLTLQYVIFT